ncbi:SusD/RagB family nutrient-binding outer membrane lipoprotein [Tunicatimonas pelagia]|uniref:SusD/RagB family nutrient-binding outer membrane lipoprotein n=1 Tax=Tunicatimonas pelagia TaxID=931531 RepID=UPI002666B106|nr:SusD/RagB family nutrient-binding outer membrane lipoprotein [Tunicatimonas pelagia]WKN42899.1 SusD/RagB family nutrient-binding outer membrane lipoprotein [Tunicatimonas pelagia]
MKILIKTWVLAGLLTVAGACTDDFEELNSNPNQPTEVDPQYLLPYAIQTSVDNYWGSKTRNERLNFDHAMSWIGYLTRNIYENEGDNYNVQPSVNITNWEVFYTDALINYGKIVSFSDADSETPNANYEGIGIGMQAWTFSILTDVWGAIPYSDALAGTAEEPVFSPSYDSQEAVYAGVIEQLRVANEKLNPDGPAIAGDIMFGGDIMMWKKLFNSTRLRLLNRQAHLVGTSSAEMQTMLADPTTYPVMESNDDIAQLVYGAVPTNNPWHDILVDQGRTDWNINSMLVEKLQSLNDPRLAVYATPGSQAEGVFSGHPSGLPAAIATNFLGFSATINQDVFAQANSPAVLMSYAELQFIMAEAALEGDIAGDSQAYFEAGIMAAFDQYGLMVPDGYIAQLGAVSKENIMTQKWLALFGQGIEAWTEYRRTGFPMMPTADPQAQFENDGVLPTRMQYPNTEYSLNGANVESALGILGGSDNMKTQLWWVE